MECVPSITFDHSPGSYRLINKTLRHQTFDGTIAVFTSFFLVFFFFKKKRVFAFTMKSREDLGWASTTVALNRKEIRGFT